MAVSLIPERELRGPGCSDACQVVQAIVPGRFGRSELLLHDTLSHELYGRESTISDQLVTGPLVVDFRSQVVTVDGKSVPLTATEWKIVSLLARHPEACVSVPRMLNEVWGEDWIVGSIDQTAHLVRTNMSRLRAKLRRAKGLILTVKARGYRLLMIPAWTDPPAFVSSSIQGLPVGRWAVNHERCQGCGTSERPHQARGYCQRCYEARRHAGWFVRAGAS